MPGTGMFGGAPGAYSNVLCLASTADEYERRVRSFLSEIGLEVQSFEDVEPLARGKVRVGVSDALSDLAGQLSDMAPVTFDTFRIYLSE